LAFPAIDSASPRNGGFLFFTDGNDHEAYDERLRVADDKDNPAFPFLDMKSPAKILQQLRDKNDKYKIWNALANKNTGCTLTVLLHAQSSDKTLLFALI
jgi:hypothetical protein